MNPNDKSPAIVELTSHRATLLTFEIKGKIAKEDIEWMARRVEAAFDAKEKIDLLLIMTHYDGADLGAVFDGEAAAAMTRSWAHVRRYGVVGAPAWARAMIELFKWTTPVKEKTFSLEELAEARRWIDEV